MPPRIRYEQTDTYETLVKGDEAIFDTYKDALLFAASIGYNRDSTDDPGNSGEIQWDVLTPQDEVVVASLAYADTEDEEALMDQELQVEILREYAAGGIDIMRSQIVEQPGELLNNMIEFLREHRDVDSEKSQRSVLEQIRQDFDDM